MTLQIPVATPGDFTHVTTDQVVINAGDQPTGPGLRVTFKIEKSDSKEPNTAEVSIYNLSPTRRASMQIKGVKILLEAGYQGTGLSRYLFGDVRTIDHVREDANWVTKIRAGDGERAVNNARVGQSFAAKTRGGDVLKYLVQQSGLSLGNSLDAANAVTKVFDQGYVVHGPWKANMDRLVRSLGLKWSIQDGALLVLSPGQVAPATVPLLSATSGLVGSPEMGTPATKGKPALLKFKGLLQPLRPGAKVKIKSDRYDGFVKSKKLAFSGDTHGEDWYVEGEGVIVR